MSRPASGSLPLIKVLGVSGGGKSTLVAGLRKLGYNARPVSQEHSDVANLWQQFEPAYVVIYLYADLAAQKARRPDNPPTRASRRQEEQRLASARQAAGLRVDTSNLGAAEVLKLAVVYLDHIHAPRADHALGPIQLTGSATHSAPQDG